MEMARRRYRQSHTALKPEPLVRWGAAPPRGAATFARSAIRVCYRIERGIVVLSSLIPLHRDLEAHAITRGSNSEGCSTHVDQSEIFALSGLDGSRVGHFTRSPTKIE